MIEIIIVLVLVIGFLAQAVFLSGLKHSLKQIEYSLIVLNGGAPPQEAHPSEASQTVGGTLSNIHQTLLRIETSLSPNGEPPWPDVSSTGQFETAQIPAPGDHNTVAAILRGIYCGNATVAKLLGTRMKTTP